MSFPAKTSSGGFSLGDISNEGIRGHYQSGATGVYFEIDPLPKTPLGPFTNMQGLGASPIIAGDSVILVADQWEHSYIAAFNLEIRSSTVLAGTRGTATAS